MEGLKIVGLCTLSAILYGILHDLVTANLCIEYFSVFHADVFHTTSPWLLALGWGVIATWWMGLFLGSLIAGAARSGITGDRGSSAASLHLPKMSWRELVRPLVVVLLASYAAAFVSGLFGYYSVGAIPAWILEKMPRVAEAHLDSAKQRAFTADLFAHNASYLVNALGVLELCIWIIRRRMKMPRPLIAGQRPV